MEDDNLTCQICLEKYDQHNPNKFPKKVLCCGQIFCLNCIEGIYKRNNNQILCPLCRKVTNIPPTQLETVTSIFKSFVSCPNCNGRITKNDFYINLETMSLKCIKCRQQEEDMSLATFLPELVNDLSSFMKGIERNNMNLYQLIELKVNQNLDDFFIKLKQELAPKLRDIVYSEIKSELQYDIISDVSSYIQNLDKLFNSYTVMNNFLCNTANFNVNTLNNEIQYYSQNMEKIREESTQYNYVFKFIDTQSTLFTLRNDIKDTEVQSFLLKIFETVLSDHKSDSLYTGIKVFDWQIEDTLTQMENIIYNYYSLVEENNTKMEKADPRIEVLNSWIDMITNMEKVIEKEQPLSQMKNFLQSMKIKTNKQRQIKNFSTRRKTDEQPQIKNFLSTRRKTDEQPQIKNFLSTRSKTDEQQQIKNY